MGHSRSLQCPSSPSYTQWLQDFYYVLLSLNLFLTNVANNKWTFRQGTSAQFRSYSAIAWSAEMCVNGIIWNHISNVHLWICFPFYVVFEVLFVWLYFELRVPLLHVHLFTVMLVLYYVTLFQLETQFHQTEGGTLFQKKKKSWCSKTWSNLSYAQTKQNYITNYQNVKHLKPKCHITRFQQAKH